MAVELHHQTTRVRRVPLRPHERLALALEPAHAIARLLGRNAQCSGREALLERGIHDPAPCFTIKAKRWPEPTSESQGQATSRAPLLAASSSMRERVIVHLGGLW